MYYMGSNPTLEWLSGLMNYFRKDELQPEDISQNVIQEIIQTYPVLT